MKKIIIILFFNTLFGHSQKKHSIELGKTTKEELQLTVYDKDSTANAVVLYDFANTYYSEEKDNYRFRTDYYKRIKLFNKKASNKATIKISLYGEQKIKDIKAITYTLEGDFIKKTHLIDGDIFTSQVSEKWKEITFTLPNISNGCVIEYTYNFVNPYSSLKDWYFQSDIPKIKSEYRVAIPGNWRYSSRLIGYRELDKKEVSVKKSCLDIPGSKKAADCILLEFGLNNVSAFKEEDYMLSKENFMSRAIFELISFTSATGEVKNYTKTWKDADKTFKNLFLDKQTSKKSYFKKKLPLHFFSISNELEKAQKAFHHIQKRMNWNNKYWTSKNLKVKRIYEEKKGSVDAINLVLYNSLQALGVESYVVAISTRDNGILTKLYPIVDDFNYVIVKAIINGETFFLDATDKFLTFGEVPIRCLNGEGRVLDFKKGSYWEGIKPRFNTSLRTQIRLAFNKENKLEGSLIVAKKGYFALDEKEALHFKTREELLDDFETKHINLEVLNVDKEEVDEEDGSIKSTYKIGLDVVSTNNVIEINPFVYNQTVINPFKLKERNYPVDFGYPRFSTQNFNLKIPKGFSIRSLPKNVGFTLPLKGGTYIMRVNTTENNISVYTKFNVNKRLYSNEEYYYLKEFYNKIIKTEESLIILEKK